MVRLASVRVCKRGRGGLCFCSAVQYCAKVSQRVPIRVPVRFLVAHAGGPWPGISGYDAVHMENNGGVCVRDKVWLMWTMSPGKVR